VRKVRARRDAAVRLLTMRPEPSNGVTSLYPYDVEPDTSFEPFRDVQLKAFGQRCAPPFDDSADCVPIKIQL
jgi:hypothetical protein